MDRNMKVPAFAREETPETKAKKKKKVQAADLTRTDSNDYWKTTLMLQCVFCNLDNSYEYITNILSSL